MLLHTHEKIIDPLDPQPDGVHWWIRRCGGFESLRLRISYMPIDVGRQPSPFMVFPSVHDVLCEGKVACNSLELG